MKLSILCSILIQVKKNAILEEMHILGSNWYFFQAVCKTISHVTVMVLAYPIFPMVSLLDLIVFHVRISSCSAN